MTVYRDAYGNRVYSDDGTGCLVTLGVILAIVAAVLLFLFYFFLLTFAVFATGILVAVLAFHGLAWWGHPLGKRHATAWFLYLPGLLACATFPAWVLLAIRAFQPGNAPIVGGIQALAVVLFPPLLLGLILQVLTYRSNRLEAAEPPYLFGPILRHQREVLGRALMGLRRGLRRFAAFCMRLWRPLGILGMLAIAVTFPIGALMLAFAGGATVLLGLWLTGLFAPVLMLTWGAWYLFMGRKARGQGQTCACGRIHPWTGPHAFGLFRIRCRCGRRLPLWSRPATPEPYAMPAWSRRPLNEEARGILAWGLLASLAGWWVVPGLQVRPPAAASPLKPALRAVLHPRRPHRRKPHPAATPAPTSPAPAPEPPVAPAKPPLPPPATPIDSAPQPE